MEETKPVAVMEDDQLMKYLRNPKNDIFEMIKKAINVAASSHPQEFQTKRDMIAQTLFSCDETATVAQVLKIKQTLDQSSSDDNAEKVLLESLSKLQHMVKSVNVLKLTSVGISVNALRKHASKDVVEVSTTLVKEWKCMVNKWMKDSENMQQQKGVESETNTKNAPQTEKEVMVPESNQKRSLIVRIKLKKAEPKGPVTPEQKVENDKVNDDNVVGRVLRIKGLLDDGSVSESIMLESLTKLLEMRLSVKTLQETGIVKSVRGFLKHGSKDARQIAWALVEGWKGLVNEYVKKKSSLNAKRKIERVGLEERENRMKESGEEKIKAMGKKVKEAYEEVEKMKKKRRIQVIQSHEVNNKGFGCTQTEPLNRKIRR